MPRIRTVKPEFWSSEDTCSVSRDARLLWIALWNYADDKGRGNASPKQIKIQVFPADVDIAEPEIIRLLSELHRAPLGLQLYEVGGKPYYLIPPKSWAHQKINKPQPAKFPEPSNTIPGMFLECSRNGHGTSKLTDNKSESAHSRNGHGTVTDHSPLKGKERKGKESKVEDLNARARDPKKDNPEMNAEEFKKTMPNPDTSFLEDPPREGLWFEKAFAEMYLEATGALWDLGGRYDDAFRGLEKYCTAQGAADRVPPEEVRTVVLANFFADPYARKVRFVPSQIAQNPGGYYRPPEGAAAPDDKPHYEKELKNEKEKLEYLEAHGKTEEAERSKNRVIRLTAMLEDM